MANRRVTVMLRIRTADGKRPYVKPLHSSNNRLKPKWALVDGKPEYHPEGVYYLRYAEGKQRVWKMVGANATDAITQQRRREKILDAKAAGIEITGEESAKANRLMLKVAIDEYIMDVSARRSYKTADGYRWDLSQFQESCCKTYLDEVNRKDLVAFMGYLRGRGFSDRTVFNRVQSVYTFVRHRMFEEQFPRPVKLDKSDWPKYAEKVNRAYSTEELKQLFESSSSERRLLWTFFVFTGAREAEVQYACWTDIDWTNKSFVIREKPELGFRTKDRTEREVPIPDQLISELKAYRKTNPHARLIFPNGRGTVENHFLRVLKSCAYNAGLNCGYCVNKAGLSCAKHPVCSRWELHAFRKSFATMRHNDGISARTIQAWLGHSDLETTEIYLKDADNASAAVRTRVNNTYGLLSTVPQFAATP